MGSDVMGCGHSNDDGVGIHLARGLKSIDDNAAVVYGTMEGNRLALWVLGGTRTWPLSIRLFWGHLQCSVLTVYSVLVNGNDISTPLREKGCA